MEQGLVIYFSPQFCIYEASFKRKMLVTHVPDKPAERNPVTHVPHKPAERNPLQLHWDWATALSY